jgi:hypothetical protein
MWNGELEVKISDVQQDAAVQHSGGITYMPLSNTDYGLSDTKIKIWLYLRQFVVRRARVPNYSP